jgi:hypothetical protein
MSDSFNHAAHAEDIFIKILKTCPNRSCRSIDSGHLGRQKMAKRFNQHDQIISNHMAPFMPKPPSLIIDLSAATKSPRASSLTPRLSRWVLGENMAFRTAGSPRSDAESFDQIPAFEKFSPDIYKNKASRKVLSLHITFYVFKLNGFYSAG